MVEELSEDDILTIERSVREIDSCASIEQMPRPQAARVQRNLTVIREVLAKVLVPYKTFEGDRRLVRKTKEDQKPITT